jgi:hypothetical protein
MKKNILFFLSLPLAFGLLSNRGNAQGTLVFNGGFDSNAAGWIATNVNRLGGWYPDKGNPGGYFFLDAVPSSLDPTIGQTIKGFIPGLTYLVSGDYAFSDDSGDPGVTPSFGVDFNGVFLFQTVKPGSPDWQTFSFFYTPSFSDEILSISAQLNGTAVSYGIDNIAIQLIPEPSSTALFVLGVAFVLCWRWRKD